MADKKFFPECSSAPNGMSYVALWRIFDGENWKKLRDDGGKGPVMSFPTSIEAVKAAKAHVSRILNPPVGTFKKPEDAPVADILGVGEYYAKKADERAQNNIRRKNKKMKPFEVEVRGNGKKTYT